MQFLKRFVPRNGESGSAVAASVWLEIPATTIAAISRRRIDYDFAAACRRVDDKPETYGIVTRIRHRKFVFTWGKIAKIKSAGFVDHCVSHSLTVPDDVAFVFG